MANIPSDWHQKWLQKFLNTVETSLADASEVSELAGAALEQLSGRDRSLGIDDYLNKAYKATEKFIEEMEDVWGYLNVDPEWTGDDLTSMLTKS